MYKNKNHTVTAHTDHKSPRTTRRTTSDIWLLIFQAQDLMGLPTVPTSKIRSRGGVEARCSSSDGSKSARRRSAKCCAACSAKATGCPGGGKATSRSATKCAATTGGSRTKGAATAGRSGTKGAATAAEGRSARCGESGCAAHG